MRHRSKKIALSRKRGPRRALLKNLTSSFVLHEAVITTPAKAKIVQRMAERCVTLGREKTIARRRKLLVTLGSEKAVRRILDELAPKYQGRSGGYTRRIKLTPRRGDGAEQVKLEFV